VVEQIDLRGDYVEVHPGQVQFAAGLRVRDDRVLPEMSELLEDIVQRELVGLGRGPFPVRRSGLDPARRRTLGSA
jgi:hypothetical protein